MSSNTVAEHGGRDCPATDKGYTHRSPTDSSWASKSNQKPVKTAVPTLGLSWCAVPPCASLALRLLGAGPTTNGSCCGSEGCGRRGRSRTGAEARSLAASRRWCCSIRSTCSTAQRDAAQKHSAATHAEWHSPVKEPGTAWRAHLSPCRFPRAQARTQGQAPIAIHHHARTSPSLKLPP